MITIKNAKTLDGRVIDQTVRSTVDQEIDAKGELLLLKGLIDSHIHLGSPTHESWKERVLSAVKGGITTLLDVPDPITSSSAEAVLEERLNLVDEQLVEIEVPLHYLLYFTIDRNDIVTDIELALKYSSGIAILIHPEQKEILNDTTWNKIFQLAAWKDLAVAINLKNENSTTSFASGETLLERAIHYTERNNARLYILNISTPAEIELIQNARKKSLLIYAETTPAHLFTQGNVLWQAIDQGMIDTIGSGYIAGFHQDAIYRPEFMLPFLLNANHEGKISLEKIVRMTRLNVQDIFYVDRDDDVILINLEKVKDVDSKIKLTGWPVYTILQGQLFNC